MVGPFPNTSCILVLWIARFRLATMHDDATPVLPSLIELARAIIVGLRSSHPQSKDLRQHLISFICMVKNHCLVGVHHVPRFPAFDITSSAWLTAS